MCGTEEIYYAAANQPFGAGVMITGSHNPADEDGFKLARGGVIPISGDSGLCALRDGWQPFWTKTVLRLPPLLLPCTMPLSRRLCGLTAAIQRCWSA